MSLVALGIALAMLAVGARLLAAAASELGLPRRMVSLLEALALH
jgi:hypothetical protein